MLGQAPSLPEPLPASLPAAPDDGENLGVELDPADFLTAATTVSDDDDNLEVEL